MLPLQPVDHVSHKGIRDAGVGLLSQQDGRPQLVQDQRVPIHLLLSRFELEIEEKCEAGQLRMSSANRTELSTKKIYRTLKTTNKSIYHDPVLSLKIKYLS